LTRFRVVFPRFQINRRGVGTRGRLRRHGGGLARGRVWVTEDMWHVWEMKVVRGWGLGGRLVTWVRDGFGRDGHVG
jgi:hypothetical protein